MDNRYKIYSAIMDKCEDFIIKSNNAESEEEIIAYMAILIKQLCDIGEDWVRGKEL